MTYDVDVTIFGGGGAGLWLLDALRRQGVAVVLVENASLGGGQTVASQGIIHGGVKYSLMGVVTASAQAIRAMPTRWRQCFAGEAQPDLSDVRLRSDCCWLWRTASMRSRLGMLGARAGLVVKPVAVPSQDRPDALIQCPGEVYRLNEPVIDAVSFTRALAERHIDCIIHGDVRELTRDRIIVGDVELHTKHIVMTAGEGNAELCDELGIAEDQPIMQKRPLHMVLVRGKLPTLNGHCVDGGRTRATITSDTDSAGRTVWQVGGQIAEDGVNMKADELIAHAQRELAAILPGVSLNDAEWATYQVNRAERFIADGKRPDDVQMMVDGNVIIAWPTKLALAPHLSDTIIAQLGELKTDTTFTGVAAARPSVAQPPWELINTWINVS